jgi:ATP phosphoribosyltransferase regulatory subunit
MSRTTVPAIRLPAGVRDFLPQAASRRRALAERLLAEFELWGFARIITPAFEYADVLERGLGPDVRGAAIRFVEPDTGEVAALRCDITPQIARVAATRLHDVDGPIRLCYDGSVMRLHRGAPGARGQREILQVGVELIDARAPAGDVEAIAVAAAALGALAVEEVRLDIGHVALVRHGLEAIADTDQREAVQRALDRKDRAGVALAARGLPRPLAELLEALPTLYGEPAAVLQRARALRLPGAVRQALDEFEQVLASAREIVAEALHSQLIVDFGEMRAFDYYDGLRLAGYVAGVGKSVLCGGRYDQLVGRYGRPAAAIGFAVDIEAAVQAQRSAGLGPPEAVPGVLVVAGAAAGGAAQPAARRAARVAAGLRAAGVRAAVDLGERRGGAAARRSEAALHRYASGVGFSTVLVLEPDRARALDVDGTPAPGSGEPGRAGEQQGGKRAANDRGAARAARVSGSRAVSLAAVERAARGDAEALIAALALRPAARIRRNGCLSSSS